MAYQAKDIQNTLRIPKIRREYVARMVGIKPEIAEGEGTGNRHLFSFGNIIEFAVAERSSLNGLNMHQSRFLLELLHKEAAPKLFEEPRWTMDFSLEPTREIEFQVWFHGLPGGGFFLWQGGRRDVCLYKISAKELKGFGGYYSALDRLERSERSFNILRKFVQDMKVPLAEVVASLDASIHVNVGQIQFETALTLRMDRQQGRS